MAASMRSKARLHLRAMAATGRKRQFDQPPATATARLFADARGSWLVGRSCRSETVGIVDADRHRCRPHRPILKSHAKCSVLRTKDAVPAFGDRVQDSALRTKGWVRGTFCGAPTIRCAATMRAPYDRFREPSIVLRAFAGYGVRSTSIPIARAEGRTAHNVGGAAAVSKAGGRLSSGRRRASPFSSAPPRQSSCASTVSRCRRAEG